MTLAPLAPPQTYCAASQTNTTQGNPLREAANDRFREKIKQMSSIEVEGGWLANLISPSSKGRNNSLGNNSIYLVFAYHSLCPYTLQVFN